MRGEPVDTSFTTDPTAPDEAGPDTVRNRSASHHRPMSASLRTRLLMWISGAIALLTLALLVAVAR